MVFLYIQCTCYLSLFIVAPLATATQSSLTKTQGQTVQLTCTITGDPYPTVTWYHDGVVLTNPQLSNNDSTLTLSPVLKSHEGIYVCRAINNLGSSNDSISLIVLGMSYIGHLGHQIVEPQFYVVFLYIHTYELSHN